MDAKATQKIEALVIRTLQECEKEGFTITEVSSFLLALHVRADRAIRKRKVECAFKDFPVNQEI